jgi:hypothetical protein
LSWASAILAAAKLSAVPSNNAAILVFISVPSVNPSGCQTPR